MATVFPVHLSVGRDADRRRAQVHGHAARPHEARPPGRPTRGQRSPMARRGGLRGGRHHRHRRPRAGGDVQPGRRAAVRLCRGRSGRAQRGHADALAVPGGARLVPVAVPGDRAGEDHRRGPRGPGAAEGRIDVSAAPVGRADHHRRRTAVYRHPARSQRPRRPGGAAARAGHARQAGRDGRRDRPRGEEPARWHSRRDPGDRRPGARGDAAAGAQGDRRPHRRARSDDEGPAALRPPAEAQSRAHRCRAAGREHRRLAEPGSRRCASWTSRWLATRRRYRPTRTCCASCSRT